LRDRVSIVKAEEPMVSYEKILLSQIEYCGKVSKEEYPLCVNNLVSLLTTELRATIINEYDQIMGLIRGYIEKENIYCCTVSGAILCTCCLEDAFKIGAKILRALKEEHPDLYLKHRHVLRGFIIGILNPEWAGVSKSALMFSIVLNTLLELKIIGPKSTPPYIGRVEG
jgi:hypothetical protein